MAPGVAPFGAGSVESWLERAGDAYAQGRVGDSAEAFARAGELAEEGGDLETAAAALNNASVLWNEAGRFEAALDAARRAVALRTEESADAATARARNSVGLSLLNLGRYQEAAEELRRALALNRALGENEGEVVNRTNLAIAAERAGDFHGASGELAQALAVIERRRDEPWATQRRAAVLLNLGVLRERLGDYRGAFEVLAPLEAGDELAASPRERAVLLQNLAVVYRNLGDPLEALARLERAQEQYRAAGDEAGAAGVRINIGIVRYLDLGDAGGALEPLRAARELAAASGERGLEAEALFHLGRAHDAAGDHASARSALERSLELATAAGAGEARWQARWGLALLDERAGDLDAALGSLRVALDDVDAVRASLGPAQDRGSYFADKRDVYAAAVRVLSRLGEQGRVGAAEEALEVVWRAKARVLLDALGPGASGGRGGEHGERSERGGRGASPPAVHEVQELLGDEVLLEYFLGSDRLYRVVADRDHVVVEDRGAAAPVLAAVREVHGSLAAAGVPVAETLAELSRALLEGAFTNEPPQRLVIAADGLLRYLPFEILGQVGSGSPLVDSIDLRYLPSGASAGPSAGAAAAATTLRGYATGLGGDPGTSAVAEGTGEPLFPSARALPALPAARAEVERAAAALGGASTLRLGADATETNFRRDAAAPARVLLVAAHAVLAEDRGGAAALALRGDGEHDGWLHAAELAGLDLDVDLAVLSACSTTLGGADDARALESLSGAFLYAGARAVVATLWDVADDDAAAFVEAFAWELGRGRDAAEALRRVKARFRADPRWENPARWAGFVLIGASPRVRTGAPGRAAAAAVGVGVVAALAFLAVALGRQGQSRKVSTSSAGDGI